ncbi:MAG: TMEM165/GDT1 family protein [Streptosporangiaceae bacterium]
MSGLLITAIALGTVAVVELPDNSGLASLVLGTRYRPLGVFAGTAAAFAVHAALAVTAGSLLALAPHKIVQIVVAAVFLAGAVLVLRADNDDDDEDEARLKADATGFWPVAATSFGVILLAELGDPSDITMANLAARYHDPVAVGIGSVLGLWLVTALAITGGRGLLRILPMRWISRLAALVMVVMAGITLADAFR